MTGVQTCALPIYPVTQLAVIANCQSDRKIANSKAWIIIDRMCVRFPGVEEVVVAMVAVGVAGLIVVMLIGGCLGMDAMGGWYRLRCG